MRPYAILILLASTFACWGAEAKEKPTASDRPGPVGGSPQLFSRPDADFGEADDGGSHDGGGRSHHHHDDGGRSHHHDDGGAGSYGGRGGAGGGAGGRD